MARTVRAIDVAAYILNQAGPIEQLKLQKLLYYCQALALARHGVPLFNDPIEAWVNGPVVRDIWTRHSYEYLISNEPEGDSTALDADDRNVVDSILGAFGKYAGWELVRFVHKDEPWIEARRGFGPKEIGAQPIDPNLMRNFYQRKWLHK